MVKIIEIERRLTDDVIKFILKYIKLTIRMIFFKIHSGKLRYISRKATHTFF